MRNRIFTTVIVLCYLSLVSEPAYAWKLKIAGVSLCHDCHRGAQVNVDKFATTAYRSTLEIARTGGDAAVKLIKAQLAGVGAAANFVESGVHAVRGDSAGAKKAFKRAKRDIHDSAKYAGQGIEKSFDAAVLSVKAPYFLQAQILDDTFRTGGNYTKFAKKTHKTVGLALKAAGQPENLGRIAIVAGASTLGGPLGSAFANAMYDKFVLKKSMTDRELFISFAIGAAAGYAAEATTSHVAVNSTSASRALLNSVRGVTQNLAQDAGQITLNHKDYSLKKFLISLGTGATQIDIEVDNNAIAQAINGSLNAAADSAMSQAIESDLKKIDMEKISDSLITGFVDGLTESAVQSFVRVALDKALPPDFERLDKKAYDEFSYMLTRFMSINHENDVLNNQVQILKWYKGLSEPQQRLYMDNMSKGKLMILEDLALKLYGKKFDDLSESQRDSESLLGEYQKVFGEYALNEATRFKGTIGTNQTVKAALSRSPASLTSALSSLFGFGAATSTATQIADVRFDLLEKYDQNLLLKGNKQQYRIYQALNKLERLGLVYLRDVAAQEGIGHLKQYYLAQTNPLSVSIDGVSKKNTDALVKMSVRSEKKFWDKYSEVTERDEFFMALAVQISDEALGIE